jgi:hypothetical protein
MRFGITTVRWRERYLYPVLFHYDRFIEGVVGHAKDLTKDIMFRYRVPDLLNPHLDVTVTFYLSGINCAQYRSVIIFDAGYSVEVSCIHQICSNQGMCNYRVGTSQGVCDDDDKKNTCIQLHLGTTSYNKKRLISAHEIAAKKKYPDACQ